MLRHKAVFGELNAVDRSTSELAILRRFPDPVSAEFRRNGDMLGVLNVIKRNHYVEVNAAVGSGKSTKLPLLISKALGCLVIHTVPFDIAARSLANYLMTDEVDGDKFVYMDDLNADMPTHGVVIMSNPFFFARHAQDKFQGVERAVLVLDESHESDAWTATLRRMAPAMKSFRCVVKATATAAPGAQMTPDLPARREIRTYQWVDVSTWSAHDRGQPWSATNIDRNLVLCIDRKETRKKLADQYRQYGFIVRDCSDKPGEYFDESQRLATDASEGIVITFVDYKYRSSLSIRGSTAFVDSCEVAVPMVVDNAPKVSYREAYDFEVQQFMGRAARIPGQDSVVWRSNRPSPKKMCDLESLECDAANLLCRMMGFRPPLEFVEYPFFDGDVPIDIAAAMASEHPLRLCPAESRVPWVNGHKALLVEKQKASYEYSLRLARNAKAVSCHTVADVDHKRAVTPPPQVPSRFRSLSVDVDGLDEFRRSRESSPVSVFTLDTSVYDNVSAALDASAKKPKRVAQRVLDARAREVELERQKTAERLSGVEAFPAGEFAPVQLGDQLALTAEPLLEDKRERSNDVAQVLQPAFAPVVNTVQPVYNSLLERDKNGITLMSGRYYHYHSMETAPETSTAFLRGVESIVAFCEGRDVRRYVKGLPDEDKLYAMRTLVEASNSSTAVAMGIQRLFLEVSSRNAEEWQDIVDHSAMIEEVEWMVQRCTEEQARVRTYLATIPLFAKWELDLIPAPLELEQRVMLNVMQRFERVAVKKDPDKIQSYWTKLNTRGISVGPSTGARRRTGMIGY